MELERIRRDSYSVVVSRPRLFEFFLLSSIEREREMWWEHKTPGSRHHYNLTWWLVVGCWERGVSTYYIPSRIPLEVSPLQQILWYWCTSWDVGSPPPSSRVPSLNWSTNLKILYFTPSSSSPDLSQGRGESGERNFRHVGDPFIFLLFTPPQPRPFLVLGSMCSWFLIFSRITNGYFRVKLKSSFGNQTHYLFIYLFIKPNL
jgi:hypothetical protein